MRSLSVVHTMLAIVLHALPVTAQNAYPPPTVAPAPVRIESDGRAARVALIRALGGREETCATPCAFDAGRGPLALSVGDRFDSARSYTTRAPAPGLVLRVRHRSRAPRVIAAVLIPLSIPMVICGLGGALLADVLAASAFRGRSESDAMVGAIALGVSGFVAFWSGVWLARQDTSPQIEEIRGGTASRSAHASIRLGIVATSSIAMLTLATRFRNALAARIGCDPVTARRRHPGRPVTALRGPRTARYRAARDPGHPTFSRNPPRAIR